MGTNRQGQSEAPTARRCPLPPPQLLRVLQSSAGSPGKRPARLVTAVTHASPCRPLAALQNRGEGTFVPATTADYLVTRTCRRAGRVGL